MWQWQQLLMFIWQIYIIIISNANKGQLLTQLLSIKIYIRVYFILWAQIRLSSKTFKVKLDVKTFLLANIKAKVSRRYKKNLASSRNLFSHIYGFMFFIAERLKLPDRSLFVYLFCHELLVCLLVLSDCTYFSPIFFLKRYKRWRHLSRMYRPFF